MRRRAPARRLFAVRAAHPNDLTGTVRRELLDELEQADADGGSVRYLIVVVPAGELDEARRRILRALSVR